MTQGHMDRSGGVASHDMLYCTSIVFLSRPEPGVICMTDDDFVHVVGDKGRRKKEKRRRGDFVIGENQLALFLTNQRFRPIFCMPPKKIFSFASVFLIDRDHPLRALAEVRLRFPF
jgi:hypothetical protein